MKTTVRRIVTVAAACVISAPALAVAQAGHDDHGTPSDAAPQKAPHSMMSPSADRIALDDRIRMLASDMRALTGDLKIDVMAALLTAMLERQALVEEGMRVMHDGMMRRMTARGADAPTARTEGADRPTMMQGREGRSRMMERQAVPAVPADSSPEEMCAPEN